jgi:hypothetical protein
LPGTIALLGDSVYEDGSHSDFANCYDLAWGRHKARTRPVPGNHEYVTPGAAGYFQYFGAAASPREPNCIIDCEGYYSYDLGDWHVVALNSELNMAIGSQQEQWLRHDLAANRSKCTLAYWHRPRFSSGAHSSDERSNDVWQVLYAYGVDVVLNGHDHHYERFAPQNPQGERDLQRGVRQFIVGTGGATLRQLDVHHPNSEASTHHIWGVLQLTLYKDRYVWEFRPIAGQTYVDRGSASCVQVEGDWDFQHFLPALH